jgi:hypothetical protein
VARLLIPLGYQPCACTTNGSIIDNIKNILKAFLNAFPNPIVNRGTIQCMVTRASTYRVEVYNLWGQLVRVAATGSTPANTLITHDLDVTGLPAGIYTVKLVSSYESVSIKVIVQH